MLTKVEKAQLAVMHDEIIKLNTKMETSEKNFERLYTSLITKDKDTEAAIKLMKEYCDTHYGLLNKELDSKAHKWVEASIYGVIGLITAITLVIYTAQVNASYVKRTDLEQHKDKDDANKQS